MSVCVIPFCLCACIGVNVCICVFVCLIFVRLWERLCMCRKFAESVKRSVQKAKEGGPQRLREASAAHTCAFVVRVPPRYAPPPPLPPPHVCPHYCLPRPSFQRASRGSWKPLWSWPTRVTAGLVAGCVTSSWTRWYRACPAPQPSSVSWSVGVLRGCLADIVGAEHMAAGLVPRPAFASF